MIRWVLRGTIGRFERNWNDFASCLRIMIAVAGWIGLAGPAAARVLAQPASPTVYTISPGRIAAVVAIVVGLIGTVIGGRALARSAGRIGAGNGRRGAIAALVLGPIGLIIGGVVVATAQGGLGTGHGWGGGILAMILGLIGIALGGLGLARSRTTA